MKSKSGKLRSAGLIAVLAAMVVCISACSSKAPSTENSMSPQITEPSNMLGGMSASTAPSAPASKEISADYSAVEHEYEYGGEAYDSDTSVKNLPSDRKIIQDAWLDIECDDASALYEQLSDFCTNLGGYQFSYDMRQQTEYSVIDAVLKIPPNNLDSFLDFAGESGKIINKKLASDDITEDYFDTQTRLETKRKALTQYFELLKSADTVESIVYIQKVIDGLTEEIESLEGRIKRWNSLVDMVTVNLYIRQSNDPVKIKRDIDWNMLSVGDVGYLIKTGFVSVVSKFVTVVQWALIIIISSAPIWILALAVILILKAIIKKRKAGTAKGVVEPTHTAVEEEKTDE